MRLKSLQIFGIFNRQDIVFEFDKSPFFLVGPNGTGKSTALKILHSILTAQWDRVSSFPFIGVDFVLDEMEFSLRKEDFDNIRKIKNILVRRHKRIRKAYKILPATWEDLIEDLGPVNSEIKIFNLAPISLENFRESYSSVSAINNYVEQYSRGRVLYFPTYRRVERDLKELLEDDEDEWNEAPSLIPSIADRFESSGEVVGFGGQDIKMLLSETATRIEGEARQALNEHSVRFLENISNDRKVDTGFAKNLIQSGKRFSKVIERIAIFAPSTVDLSKVTESVEKLGKKLEAGGRGRLNQREETLLTYLGELVKLINKIDDLSFPLRKFSELISEYLGPIKRAELRESDNAVLIYDYDGNELELDMLSSGEKQILSFFAFLLLKGSLKNKFIIIDEPELSLSVSWQKTLIRDILSISPDAYLISATHSPFIFQSFGLSSVKSLGEL